MCSYNFFFLICQILCLSLFLVIYVDKFICFRYHEANGKAKERVLEILRGLAAELQYNINILVFSSTLLVIAKALFAHARFVNFCLWLILLYFCGYFTRGFDCIKSTPV